MVGTIRDFSAWTDSLASELLKREKAIGFFGRFASPTAPPRDPTPVSILIDAQKFSDSVSDLLKIENVNFNPNKQQRQLLGYAISAKRYTLFERVGDELNIIDPKAHGLGYLYPPADPGTDNHDWTFAAWDWLLRNAFALPNIDSEWLDLPAMMRVRVSTPNVLKHLDKILRPFNFVLCPLIDTLVGYPAGINRDRFALLTSFTKNRGAWMKAECINIHDKSHHSLAFTQTPQFDKVITQTFGYILRLYPFHPESKPFAPDGSPCAADTQGVLQRMHVTAMRARYIGKETDRKWEHGEDFSLLAFKPAEFETWARLPKQPHANRTARSFANKGGCSKSERGPQHNQENHARIACSTGHASAGCCRPSRNCRHD